MGENIIERVARIIDPQSWALVDHWRDKDTRPDLEARVPGQVAPSIAKARAAIAALREPSDAMIEAGEMCDAADVWRSMIDAALTEGNE